MTKNIFLFFFILSTIVYGQDNVVYYDINENLISKDKFEAIDDNIFFKKIKRNDSITIYYIGNKESQGKLNDIQKEQFFSVLEKFTSRKLNKGANTIIHFYREDFPDLKETIKNRKYWRWIKKNPERVNAFVICSKASNIDVTKSKKLYLDNYNIIERLFLKSSSNKINHIIIQPDGSFKILEGASNIICLLDSCI